MLKGTQQFVIHTKSGARKQVCAQVADVNKALLSVSQMCNKGHRVVFDSVGSFIQDKESGEMIPFVQRGSTYTLNCMVRADGSAGVRPVFTGPR